MEENSEGITHKDLGFLATLCILALKDLGHIERSQFKQWAIQFSDTCIETHVLGGTLRVNGNQAILISPNITKANVLETIAHEAVHLIQHMKGDVKSGEGHGVIEWKGVPYKILPGNDPGYDKQPWEEEAYRLTPEIIADLKSVPVTEIMKVWLSNNASQWSLDLFVKKDW
jgi:hypothetical protein